MRKSPIPTMVALCLLSATNLFGQSPYEQELEVEATKFIKSESVQNFATWFGSPSFQNFILAIVIFSIIYFSLMLTLFVLINKEVISVEENSFVALLMEDWMTKKAEAPIPAEQLALKEQPIFEQLPTIEYPNWEILCVEMNGNT